MYAISDIGEGHLLTREGLWRPLPITDFEGLVTFDSLAEACAFCIGYRLGVAGDNVWTIKPWEIA